MTNSRKAESMCGWRDFRHPAHFMRRCPFAHCEAAPSTAPRGRRQAGARPLGSLLAHGHTLNHWRVSKYYASVGLVHTNSPSGLFVCTNPLALRGHFAKPFDGFCCAGKLLCRFATKVLPLRTHMLKKGMCVQLPPECLRHAYPIGIPRCADNRSMHRR